MRLPPPKVSTKSGLIHQLALKLAIDISLKPIYIIIHIMATNLFNLTRRVINNSVNFKKRMATNFE